MKILSFAYSITPAEGGQAPHPLSFSVRKRPDLRQERGVQSSDSTEARKSDLLFVDSSNVGGKIPLVRSILLTILIFASVCVFAGCYSFTGSSVPPHLKTVGVELFEDQSGAGIPDLRENIRDKVTAQFNSDNSLQVTDVTKADCEVSGSISTVVDAPLVISAGTDVTSRRVTINVVADFQDLTLKKKVWEKTFTNFGDYVAGSSIAARQAAIDAATEKISEDIVLAVVSGW
jgi:hypothetical protein